MLPNYQQFVIRQSVRNPMGLLNPPIIPSSEATLPRDSVIHYLDYSNTTLFPTKQLPYLTNTPKSKKVPVAHITQLSDTIGTTILANRTVNKQLLAWRKTNISDFRVFEKVSELPVDVQVNSIVNYQILRDLYTYKAGPTAELNRYRNVYKTYWDTVHQAIEVTGEREHFVRVPIAHMIPSKALLDNLLKYPDTAFARVVRDYELNAVIDLYKFLNRESPQGVMTSLTDQDTARITLELTFKGYSFFFKLSYLVGLSKHSPLPSKRKLETKQLQRMFLIMLLKVQQKVYDIENGVNTELEDEQTAIDNLDNEEHPEVEEYDEQEGAVDERGVPVKKPIDGGKVNLLTAKEIDNQVSSGAGFDANATHELSNLINTSNTELEGASDDIFAKLMSHANDPQPQEEMSVNTPDIKDKPNLPSLEVDYSDERRQTLLRTKSKEENFQEYVTSAKLSGGISTVEARSLKKLFEARSALKSPYSNSQIDQDKVVTEKDTAFTEEEKRIHIKNNLVDDDLKSETMFNFDKLYLNKVMKKDILACVTHLESAGIIIKDYQVESNDSALGNYEVHKLTLKPYKGKESTVYFRIPKINDEGDMINSGIKTRMRRQRVDLVIRKVSPIRVSLTTNYSKLFISRTERKAYDPYSQIATWIKTQYLEGTSNITSIMPGNVFDNHKDQPNMFMAMSRNFKQFSTKDYTFIFSDEVAAATVKPEVLETIKRSGKFFVGFVNKDKSLLVMDKYDLIYAFKGDLSPLGKLPSLIGMDTAKIPIPFATIKILGDDMALGPVLAYYMGFKGLLESTQTKFTIVGPRQQSGASEGQVVIRLQDCKVVVDTDTPTKQLLFGGFAFYKDNLKQVGLVSLESQSFYLGLFEQRDHTLMHLRELDLLQSLFLDPISVDVLRSMKEPEEYLPLLLRACELLSDFKHPDINDPRYSRIRGYDRVPGLMYRTLTKSVRSAKFGMTKGKIELDPYGVWNAITQDTTVKIVEDSNPVVDVKEAESVTFSGADGLNKSSTPEKLRRYHPKDVGLVSEATVDSSDVALNFFLTPYPKLENLRGIVGERKTDRKDTVFSTSVLLSPMAEHDD